MVFAEHKMLMSQQCYPGMGGTRDSRLWRGGAASVTQCTLGAEPVLRASMPLASVIWAQGGPGRALQQCGIGAEGVMGCDGSERVLGGSKMAAPR